MRKKKMYWSIREQTTINHISICFFFLPQYQRQSKWFSSGRELEKVLRDILTRAAWYGLLFTTAN